MPVLSRTPRRERSGTGDGARLLQMAVPNQLCHTQRTARITGGRLDPQLLERSFAENPTVADAVERHATRETQVLHSGFAMDRACHAQHDLFADHLHGPRKVHLLLRQLRLRLSRRTAEELVEGFTGHREAGEIVEVLLVERERAILAQIHQLAIDEVHVLWRTIRGEAHHLVLARIHLEAGVIRERRVQKSERIGPAELLEELQLVAASNAIGGGGPFADTIHGEDRRFLERAGEEGARRVRLVMLGVEKVPLEPAECVTKLPVGEELFLYPQRSSLEERAESARCDTEISLENPLELEERLVIE